MRSLFLNCMVTKCLGKTWIQKGEGTLVVSNGMYAFQSNQIFCICANQPHVFRSDPAYFNSKDKTGTGSEYVRALRLILKGEERQRIKKVIADALSCRPTSPDYLNIKIHDDAELV